jgi:hypothetical protein
MLTIASPIIVLATPEPNLLEKWAMHLFQRRGILPNPTQTYSQQSTSPACPDFAVRAVIIISGENLLAFYKKSGGVDGLPFDL